MLFSPNSAHAKARTKSLNKQRANKDHGVAGVNQSDS